jgi:hypothetical protein
MTTTKQITSYYIYPAIGIARVGNSKNEYLIAPEAPGQKEPTNPNSKTSTDIKYKDDDGKVKRQAARFRVYGLDEDGNVVDEVVNDENTSIEWRVHLANRKAINYQFNNAMDLGSISMESRLRNEDVTDWEKRKDKLLIDPRSRSIKGCNTEGEEYQFNSGTFYGTEIPLGELKTDEKGNLLVLGGFGHSANKLINTQAITFANNNGWHDDVSDGPVRATITIKGETFEAKPAMVAVTPPNFAPGIRGVVTMYDVVKNLFYEEEVIPQESHVSFWRDIYPIFERLVDNQAVNEGLYFMFGENSPGDFTNPKLSDQLADNSSDNLAFRKYIFDQFRDPECEVRKDALQPPYYGDAFSDFKDVPNINLSITKIQYQQMKDWADGNFTNEDYHWPTNIDEIPLSEQPAALTATTLLECLGGPFHPGIELTWFLRRLSMWNTKDSNDPMRLNIMSEDEEPRDDFGPILRPERALKEMFNTSGPGTLTRFMGVPWQTDEASCRSGYDPALYLPTPSFWSARVPNQVMSIRSLRRMEDKNLPTAQRLKHMDLRQDWLRFFAPGYQNQINGMVDSWHEIGIIKRQSVENHDKELGIPAEMWVESEVAERLTENDFSYKQLIAIENPHTPVKGERLNEICDILEKEADKDPENRQVFRRDER